MSLVKRALGKSTSKVLGVRLPLEELAIVETAAATAGQKPGIWAREVLLRAAAPGRPEWLSCEKCGAAVDICVVGPHGRYCVECSRAEYVALLEQGQRQIEGEALRDRYAGSQPIRCVYDRWEDQCLECSPIPGYQRKARDDGFNLTQVAERAENAPDDRGHEQLRPGEPPNEIAGGEPRERTPCRSTSDDPPAANPQDTANFPPTPGLISRALQTRPQVRLTVDQNRTADDLRADIDRSHAELSRSWLIEWERMQLLDPAAAMERFNQLRAGRELPDGFRQWPKAEKIAWLDREWPL